MKIAPRRLAASAIVLAAIAVSGAAAFGEWPLAQTMVVFAVVWLLMVGWGFHTLLARHLRFNDRLACTEMELGMERHARTVAERTLGDTHAALCRLIEQQEQVREQGVEGATPTGLRATSTTTWASTCWH
jgi:hypothetical protein